MRINKVYNVIFVQVKVIKVDTNTDNMSTNMSVSLFYFLLLQNHLYQPEITQKAAKTSENDHFSR